MEHISSVIWLLGWPLVWSICNYIDNKINNDKEQEKAGKGVEIVFLIIWVTAAILLY